MCNTDYEARPGREDDLTWTLDVRTAVLFHKAEDAKKIIWLLFS
jgi:hypothetical protein